MNYGSRAIDEVLTFSCNTHDPATEGNPVIDADDVPSYRVYEDETGTPILTGSMAKLDDSNTLGFYSEAITLSVANGFERLKSYHVRILAAVGGVSQVLLHTFQIGAAVHVQSMADNVITEDAIDAGAVSTDADIAQAVWEYVTRTLTPDTPSGAVVADGANSATTFVTNRTETTTDYWKDALCLLTSGVLAGQVKKVTGYNGTTKAITVQGGFTGTPAAAVAFLLINR